MSEQPVPDDVVEPDATELEETVDTTDLPAGEQGGEYRDGQPQDEEVQHDAE